MEWLKVFGRVYYVRMDLIRLLEKVKEPLYEIEIICTFGVLCDMTHLFITQMCPYISMHNSVINPY